MSESFRVVLDTNVLRAALWSSSGALSAGVTNMGSRLSSRCCDFVLTHVPDDRRAG